MNQLFRRIVASAALMFVTAGALAPLAAQAQDANKAPAAAPAERAAAPTPAAPAPAAPTVSKVTVDNPYGFMALIKQGGPVSLMTLIVLAVMSMGSWYIIFVKLWEQRQMIKEGKDVNATFWKSSSLEDGAKKLKDGSAYRYVVESGLEANSSHQGALTQNIDKNTWVGMGVQRAIDAVNSRSQEGLSFLATVGSTAPFVGLFGTVWGIFKALTDIGIAGQASIDKVAGPVGEALIMTALGLAVAVPAVMGYNWLIRRNKAMMEQVRGFGGNVHAVLIGRRP
ncbi:MAG: MotA/TolQ/ExbB proton channel family protein [Burkholderiales bacterium]|jgi:biopolymer transport protein ExbB|nr:MotA/TolQ/ExbB proton channel family protein [Burkholderiales bacterium]